MVKFYEQTHVHTYPFETVTLGWFLRYPNPYSTHVLSTDTIERHFDAATGRLYTARLHLKRSKIPTPIARLLPTSLLGTSMTPNGESTSYILERSVVDVQSGVMLTESRNLEFTGVLTVVERQCYRRPDVDMGEYLARVPQLVAASAGVPTPFAALLPDATRAALSRLRARGYSNRDVRALDAETDVTTKVELKSRFGQVKARVLASRARSAAAAAKAAAEDEEETQSKGVGLFGSWGQGAVQRTIEAVGLRRTERAVPKSKEGMNVVLERLRNGGLVAVLEGMKRDRETVMAGGEA